MAIDNLSFSASVSLLVPMIQLSGEKPPAVR
jgi:hypothetical protein